ncbi:hypothetical protein EOPP23_16805 [Endozoicomonas sp. OPT23]|uniref:helix-turn-helix transcriptional regulator n=1 Tax=Endozoicomonas sp. OPT23 TaxID=2072845 RepID=UPI00129A6E7D|nr:helix-turn-helix transcriptional regulator [Endozoicomonas sp. OPT23]MRI34645.1 hypothetical protein [Endozoicomonas sp. OPT23]
MKSTTSLVAEEYLTDQLAPLWRRRLIDATNYVRQTLSLNPAPSLSDIAHHCAVSPFHLHRMFQMVFSETPGQYIRRLRLQVAVNWIYERPDKAITEIAHECGFSSSQALAKVLKRELGMTARDIRNAIKNGDNRQIDQLCLKLGHPQGTEVGSLEEIAAKTIDFSVVERPDMAMKVWRCEFPWYESVEGLYNKGRMKLTNDLYLVNEIEDLNKPYAEWNMKVGTLTETGQQENLAVKSGRYLSCDVSLSSDAGYIAVWMAMFDHITREGLEVNETGLIIEKVMNPDVLVTELKPVRLQVFLELA